MMTSSNKITWAESRTTPEILAEKREGAVVELEFFVPEELFQFQGHFPGEPILPGVAQLDWVGRFAKSAFGYDRGFCKLGQLKFSRLIRAGSHLRLRLEMDEEKGRLGFSYCEGGETCSSGFLELTGP
jgi:3-hydroxymyristoyl/3-hydroxydecanoyl-(acyl carrier protein) dehydratase